MKTNNALSDFQAAQIFDRLHDFDQEIGYAGTRQKQVILNSLTQAEINTLAECLNKISQSYDKVTRGNS